MKFTTPVEVSPLPLQLTPQSRVVILGSCFAEHIGKRLSDALPPGHASVNPFGVLYHPSVVARALEQIAFPRPLPKEIFFEGRDGLWHSWWHSGSFSAPSREECVHLVEQSLAQAQATLQKADWLILTLSTDHGFYLNDAPAWGDLVANCHKMPNTMFAERVTPFDALVAEWAALLQRIKSAFPQLRILWTVSPYRYAKHGMHQSQLSKARLHLLVDALMQLDCSHSTSEEVAATSVTSLSSAELAAASSESVWQHYFPAYEILLDELRDYRFFAPDMLHPSDQAAEYIWQKFRDAAFSPELLTFSAQVSSLRQALAHRPLHPDSDDFRRFQALTQQRLADFQKKYGLDGI